jgi:hypothetical protein
MNAAFDDWPPSAEPIPTFVNEFEKQGARRALLWLLLGVGPKVNATKWAALQYVFRLEPRKVEVVVKKIGVSKAAISKQVVAIADALNLPAFQSSTARENKSRAQRRAWQRRRTKKYGNGN